jgi:Adenine-specific methyltransferase EcoRI
MAKTLNKNLHSAKNAKKDEFYTQLSDIERELAHYKEHFRGKVVLCNCDDPRISNFFHYFSYNFEHLELKKLITTCYKSQSIDLFSEHNSERAIYLEYDGDKNGNKIPDIEEIGIKYLTGDGDFRSAESIELLKQADIVVTNPPFSLFREYVAQLIAYEKKFLIIGTQNAVSYTDIVGLIRTDKIWLGYTHPINFRVPESYELRKIRSWVDDHGNNWRSLGNACWFTNLDIKKRHEDLILVKSYSKSEYPEYDNYHAIEVSKFADIPHDYAGVMGVPITFLDKYNPAQFEIVGFDYEVKQGLLPDLIKEGWSGKLDRAYMNGRRYYARVLIKNKRL